MTKSLGMTKTAILSQFDRLLPLAVSWVGKQEGRMLRLGVPLNEQELRDAHTIGVAEPERVRLVQLDCVPFPTDPMLTAAATAIQFLTPATCGLTLRYGIFIRSDCWRERALVAHELVHVMQYERCGGIRPFLRQYLTECITIGYPQAPLEQEAIALSRSVLA
jgi:hypothetical protein